MAINGEESSLTEYTSKWISLCNRGGLFEINDMSYLMFRDIELKVRKYLFSILGEPQPVTRKLSSILLLATQMYSFTGACYQ